MFLLSIMSMNFRVRVRSFPKRVAKVRTFFDFANFFEKFFTFF